MSLNGRHRNGLLAGRYARIVRRLSLGLVARCALLIAPSALYAASPPKVLLSTTTLLPGETLRVEVDGLPPAAKCKVAFAGKLYPLFAIGPDAQRALIGIRLDAKPGLRKLTLRAAPAGSVRVELPREPYQIDIASRTFVTENVNFAPGKTALMKAEHKEADKIHRANLYLSRDQQWEGSFIYPVEGQMIGEFGLKRLRNGKIDAGFHKGIDLRAAKGTPVLAANSGTVVMASHFKAHGNMVLINHGQGVMTIYLHMQSIKVKLKEKVHKGQQIGKVGATGLATAPHVHYQVFVHGVPVDPKQWTETEF